MADQVQRVKRLSGPNQVVEIISGGGITTVPTPTTTVRGGVLVGASIAAVAAATATADTASTATDVAGLLADHNDLVTKYNALLTDAAALRTTLNAVLSAESKNNSCIR
ncbi:phenylalanyl-tRNA synthetase subunit beta [Klebsiella pneumoniae]